MTHSKTPEAERALLRQSYSSLNWLIGFADGLRIGAGVEKREFPKFVVEAERDLREYLTGEHITQEVGE